MGGNVLFESNWKYVLQPLHKLFSKELSFLINSQGLLWNSLGREWHLVGDRRIWNSYIWVKSLRSRFITVNFFFRWCPVVWGILVPSPGFELVPPLRWKYGVLTTGPPGKSQAITLIYLIFMYLLCQLLVAACEIFSCSKWALVPWPEIETGTPTLGEQILWPALVALNQQESPNHNF